MDNSPELGLKYGRDAKLEAEANKWLYAEVGDNKRSPARDVEKTKFEHGSVTEDDLQHYDPVNTWDTKDSAYSIAVDPDDVDWVESTICADVDDGNVRRRHDKLLERKALMRHIEDSDSWGLVDEDEVPLLGVNEGPRKVCTRCKRSKGLSLFSPRTGRRGGLQSWCKQCRREVESQKRNTSE